MKNVIIWLSAAFLLAACSSKPKISKSELQARRAAHNAQVTAFFERVFPITEDTYIPPYTRYAKQRYTVKVESGTWFGKSSGNCRGKQLKDDRWTVSLEHIQNNEFRIDVSHTGCNPQPTRTYRGRMIDRTLGFVSETSVGHKSAVAYVFSEDGSLITSGGFSTGKFKAAGPYNGSRSEKVYETAYTANLNEADVRKMRHAAQRAQGGDFLGNLLRGSTLALYGAAEEMAARSAAEAAARRVTESAYSSTRRSSTSSSSAKPAAASVANSTASSRTSNNTNSSARSETTFVVGCPYENSGQYQADKEAVGQRIRARREAGLYEGYWPSVEAARAFDQYEAEQRDALNEKFERLCPTSRGPSSVEAQ